MTDAERSFIYDDLFEEADNLFKEYNPCKVKNGKCVRGEPCCASADEKCTHLDLPKGCNIKSLTCKLWLCGIIEDLEEDPTYLHFLRELKSLKRLSHKYLFPVFRGTKQQSLERSKMYEVQEATYHNNP